MVVKFILTPSPAVIVDIRFKMRLCCHAGVLIVVASNHCERFAFDPCFVMFLVSVLALHSFR